jgi:TolB-like protein
LLADRNSLAIDLSMVSVDAIEAAGESASKTGLLTMFEGGFLEELDGLDPAFDVWLSKERRRMAAIARMGGETFLEERHPRHAVIVVARSLLRLYPAHDVAWRALIEAHIEAGDRASARYACEQWGEAKGVSRDDTPPEEIGGFLSRIRFGSSYRPLSAHPGVMPVARPPAWSPAAGVSDDVLLPRAPDPNRGGAGDRVARGEFPDSALPEDVFSGGGYPEDVFPDGALPADIYPEDLPSGVPLAGLLADGVTPARVIPEGNDVARAVPIRVLSDNDHSVRPESGGAPRIPGVSEASIPPGSPIQPRAALAARMPYRVIPGGAARARTASDKFSAYGVAEETILPGAAMPGRLMPDVLVPDEAPKLLIPAAPAGAELWNTASGPWSGEELTRTSLRLGIREMRVIGPNVDQALSAGLAEEITTALSHFQWLSCVSGSSHAAIAGDEGEAGVSWPELDLDLLLDGTIQGSGDRVRITVRLLDMHAGEAVIWARRFNQDSADTLNVQDRVAAAIVAQLEPLLLIREGDLAATRRPRGASARDLVLQAVPAIYRMDRLSFRAAGELLEAALRLEPANTDALAWFAYWHLFLVGQGWADDPEAATRRAGMLADTAVSMDPNDARALTLAGHVRGFLLRRPAEAALLHDRAISLNPNLAIAWCFSGFALTYLGEHAKALARMGKAIELSPSDPHLFFFLSATIMPRLLLGEYEEAAAAGRGAIELNPWFSSSFKGCLAALGHLGLTGEAASMMARLLRMEPGFTVQNAIRRSPMSVAEDIIRYSDGLRRAGLPEG